MKKKIAIIGAGLAGISLASLIKDKFNIKIFEKSRGVGGRMSTRKSFPFTFDHGAQFFKIETKEFLEFASEMLHKNIIKPWNFKYAHYDGNDLKKITILKNKDKYFVGVPHMDSIVKYLSNDLDILLNTKVEKILKKNHKWQLIDQNKKIHAEYDWIVLSLPAEQSFNFISKDTNFYSSIKKIKMKGCFSLMIGFEKPIILNFDAAFIENKDISWIAVNSSKPARKGKYSIIVNSSYEFAKKNINTPKIKVLSHLYEETRKFINQNLANPTLKNLHQWMYVEAEKAPIKDFFIDTNKNIGVCGDWFLNSRVENAFTSALKLSKQII